MPPIEPRQKAWSVRMEGYGGPAQPSPTIGQCLNGGYGWLEIECCRCKTRASLPLDAIRRVRETPIWKLEPSFRCRSCGTHRYKPPVLMIKLTERREITPRPHQGDPTRSSANPVATLTRPISTMHTAETQIVRQPQRNCYLLRPIAYYRHYGPATWIDPVVLRAITISWNNIVIPVRSCPYYGHPDDRPFPWFTNDLGRLRMRWGTKRA